MARWRRGHLAFRSGRSVRLTGRGRFFGLASAVLIVVAYAAENRVVLALGLFCAALVVLGFGLASSRSLAVVARRRFSPSPVTALRDTTVSVTIENSSRWPSAPAWWNDTLPWRPLATDPSPLPRLAATTSKQNTQSVTIDYTLRPPRRGHVEVGPMLLAYSDPFGMAVAFVATRGRDPLVVTPPVVALPDSGMWLEAPDGTAHLVQATGVGNADDLMTREYRRGDALRRVHWRASARHGELMVRQEEQRAFPQATVVIDTRVAGYLDLAPAAPPEPAVSEYFEWSVTMLASLSVHLHRAGFAVRVLETATTQLVPLADEEGRQSREDDFLMSLAAVDLIDEGGTPHGSASGPVFAIISTPDAETLAWLRSLRSPFELGVIFLVGADAATAAPLLEAGWRVVPTDESVDPVTAWTALVDEVGPAHVGA